MKRSIVQNGRVTIPLFHGTSTLFYKSIAETGLGGRDIVEEFGIRSAARRLVELCRCHQPWTDWQYDVDACANIATTPENDRRGNMLGFSFRYGKACLSPSRTTAVMYARLYNCGEALTYTLKLLDKLSAVRPDLTPIEEFAAIRSLACGEKRPLLIEVHDVEVASLQTEQGGSDCTQALRYIEETLAADDAALIADTLIGQTNFELLKPVLPHQLRFYEVKKREKIADESEDEAVDLEPFGMTAGS